MDPEREKGRRFSTRVTIDLLILIILAIPVASFYVVDYVPFQRGYFCDDDSIRYPYKDSTVSDCMLYVYGVGIPVIIIIFVELIHAPTTEVDPSSSLYGWQVPARTQILYKYITPFLFGGMLTDMTSNATKLFVGRLRPNFLDACKSDFDCLSANDPHMYVVNYTCTNTNLNQNSSDIRLSFPSGHSSFSMYAMLYAVVFLQRRLSIPFSGFLKGLLQIALMLLATYTAASRTEDNKHHWSDVMVGLLHGIVFGCLTIYCFPIYPRISEENDKNDGEMNNLKGNDPEYNHKL